MNINSDQTVSIYCYPDYFVFTKDFSYFSSNKKAKQSQMLKNQRVGTNGFLSPTTSRKIKTILTTWMLAVKEFKTNKFSKGDSRERKLTFATLTLSGRQKHTDNEIKRNLLNEFLIVMKRKYNMKYYFWRAEKQKNGNIHFHVIFDTYISNVNLQKVWNNIQEKNGYMDDFFEKFGRKNAPSTDIRKISDLSKSIEYVLKYVSKDASVTFDEKLKVNGRIWGCSKELKDLKPYSLAENSQLIEAVYEESKKENVKFVKDDFFEIFFIDTERFLKERFPSILKARKRYYIDVYNYL